MTYARRFAPLLMLLFFLGSQASARELVWVIDIKGAVGPASADHMVRGLAEAQQAGAEIAILQIDTPGGLDTAMRQMIQAILAAKIPVVGYVAPGGARAASAGTYILYACHVAAMAPATNLGAATPVQIGPPRLPALPSGKSDGTEDGPEPGLQPGTAMERKIINDAVAYIQSLAQLRGRNEEWASRAVREGASRSAERALDSGVIDIVASDIDDLLNQLNGRTLILNNAEITLNVEKADIYTHSVDWRSNFLSVITNPNIAYLLMLIGIYGLIFELSNPGFGIPGVLGVVCTLLALYAFQLLPISYAGLGLMILGVGLMAAEAFAPSFGVLGIGGVTAFVIGSVILMDTRLPAYQIALPVIIAFASVSAGLLIFALGLVLKARRQTLVTGLSRLVGSSAMVNLTRGGNAYVSLDGELWQAECEQPLRENDKVTITAANGVILQVKRETGG